MFGVNISELIIWHRMAACFGWRPQIVH